MRHSAEINLFTKDGQRKYLTPSERESFATYAKYEDRKTRTFCLMLLETGMRRSETLSLTIESIDLSSKCVNVETLKKRKKGIYRQIPLSDDFLNELNLVYEIRENQKSRVGRKMKLWEFSERTANRRIDQVMKSAGIEGEQATPKGLRHGFGVACVLNKIPLPTIQKWLGHSSMTTTAIYLQATGEEERELASRLWT